MFLIVVIIVIVVFVIVIFVRIVVVTARVAVIVVDCVGFPSPWFRELCADAIHPPDDPAKLLCSIETVDVSCAAAIGSTKS